VPLCPPQILYRLAYKCTRVSLVKGPGLTVRTIYLWWEKWPKNAFHSIDQSQCVVLHVACVTNTGCVLFERLCNKLPNSCSVWSWLYMPNIACPIFGLFSLISSIHHCWLRNSRSQHPDLMTARNLHVISVPQNRKWWPHCSYSLRFISSTRIWQF